MRVSKIRVQVQERFSDMYLALVLVRNVEHGVRIPLDANLRRRIVAIKRDIVICRGRHCLNRIPSTS